MSQTSIESYFPTRKRPASDEARGKNKVLILDQNQTRTVVQKTYPATDSESLPTIPEEKIKKLEQNVAVSHAPKLQSVVRNIQFDSTKSKSPKTRKPRTRRVSVEEGQADIRDTFQKKVPLEEAKTVPFEKKGSLTPKKSDRKTEQRTPKKIQQNIELNTNSNTPKKVSNISNLLQKDMSLDQIKTKLMKSKRLNELRARINKISELDKKLEDASQKKEKKEISKDKPEIKKFDSIELEVPVSPQKTNRSLMMSPSKKNLDTSASPTKSCRSLMMSPTKTIQTPSFGSPSRLLTPKKSDPSPVKVTPIKEPAYKRFADLATSKEEFALPEHYRFLGELFRCIDTVVAMLYNRGELVTFSKLKPSVQEMLRRNLTLEHLAQIKHIYPEAYEFKQEKYHQFAQTVSQDKYHLTITPTFKNKNDHVESVSAKTNMGPNILLGRRRKMYALLLDKVMDEHDEFLKSVDMKIDRKDLTRWHPAFDVNTCKPIEKAKLPAPPNIETLHTVTEVLSSAKKLFHCNPRMENALKLLAESDMTMKKTQTTDTVISEKDNSIQNTSVVDTPPTTPKVTSKVKNSMLKGIPQALLEKVRAKQAAKALEEMTRPAYADKEIAMYAQLPSMAQLLRNIFVSEKKNVLTLEFVLSKLDNSYRMKMTITEFEKHIKLLSSLLPTWISLLVVRKVSYVKLLKNVELTTIIKRLELHAKEKIESFQKKRA